MTRNSTIETLIAVVVDREEKRRSLARVVKAPVFQSVTSRSAEALLAVRPRRQIDRSIKDVWLWPYGRLRSFVASPGKEA